jgi:hypothetical protein
MKLIVVSNGTKEGTFVRNADTGEALEGVEHIAFNFDGEKCVTTVMLTTGLVVNGQILALPLTDAESRNVQDSVMSPGGFTPKPMTGFTVPKAPDTSKGLPEDDGFLDPAAALNALKALDKGAQVDYGMGLKRCEDCNVVLSEGACSGRVSAHGLCPECGERAPHAHHKEEGGVRLSTKHIPKQPTLDELMQCDATILDKLSRAVTRCKEKAGHLCMHAGGALRWNDNASRVPDPFAHCTYCKLYYCDASSDHSCMEASDHQHKWVPPFTAFKPPPVLPTRVGYVAGKSEYVGKFETRKEIPIGKDPYLELVGQYPHCDAYVLHARGTCEFCDLPSNAPLHEWRKATNTNYTGENDPLKSICPAELRRSKATIDKWYGNTAKPKEKT